MPFWWQRRKRYWWPRRNRFQRRKRFPKRRRKRIYKRRRAYPAHRRRRRRRHKVRKKKKKLNIVQWQPDCIRKCKIKGTGILVLGGEGTQFQCYTTEKDNYIPPKMPYGGGFGAETYTLQYLYEQYGMHNNIWTSSNEHKDLVRYTGCKFRFFRHPDTDFVINYTRTLPEQFTKYTFPAIHPHQQLLQKHKRLVLSTTTNPKGKLTTILKIKPPKQMINKWFFTKNFTKYPLVVIKGAAVNFRYSYLSASGENASVNIYAINPQFYKNSDWDQARGGTAVYEPITNMKYPVRYKNKTATGESAEKDLFRSRPTSDTEAFALATGWFSTAFLQATTVTLGGTTIATVPMLLGRYNPTIDDGVGNVIYIKSTLKDSWKPPETDKSLELTELPLWLGLYGITSYVHTIKPPSDFPLSHLILVKSKAITCAAQVGGCDMYAPIDLDYVLGKKSYDQVIKTSEKTHWTPNMTWQMKALNTLVESGPFIPKYSEEKNSTWELKYNYTFYFKWGGPPQPDAAVKDPTTLPSFDVPDTIQKRIQIKNPEKQTTESLIHPWDMRRGYITKTALKRIYDNLQTDTEFEPIETDATPKKKKRRGAAYQGPEEEKEEISHCLQKLCEENIFQETPQTTIEDLIKQQQFHQQQIKYNIIKLLVDLKEKQQLLQLQTGLLD
nr:MAG: ORF1 [Torque teno midi virus]